MLVAGRAVSYHPARSRPARNILFWRRSFHVPRIDETKPRRYGCANPRLVLDEQSCSSHRRPGPFGFAEHSHAASSWPIRAILQRAHRTHGCMLAPDHLWTAIAYVERNPVRARIVRHAEDYLWSSANAHVNVGDANGLPDMEWWRKQASATGARCCAASRRRPTMKRHNMIRSSISGLHLCGASIR